MTAVAESAAPRLVLRCAHCSHVVGVTAYAMQFVGVVRASANLRLVSNTAGEVRKRCTSCGWVNVFHPPNERTRIEVK